MMSLMDGSSGVITRALTGNMLQGFSNIGSAMDIIRQKVGGNEGICTILVMADQMGMAGDQRECLPKIFQAVMDTVNKANASIKGAGVKLDLLTEKEVRTG
jgi:hypothetical protein